MSVDETYYYKMYDYQSEGDQIGVININLK